MLRDRYPDSDILAQREHWDDATRRVILDRVYNVPRFRFFDAHARATLLALCECIVPQGHRPENRRVPIAPWIDARCDAGGDDGFRFDDMPGNREAWTSGLEGLDQTAHALSGRDFAELDDESRYEVLRAIRDGVAEGDVWRRLPPRRWWTFVALRQITGLYYAHPYAWDEIGFGGPAYPRGYQALNFGAPEPWEAREQPDRAEPKKPSTPAGAPHPRIGDSR
ncbi:MAG TPA: gluconate 2-dehydrogenase subunit 3 family protein [Gemmatimonadaceae bacterium]|nr:gluconate 2-dehydrogenase subunit 3 family protein [Gemmatimonadaceae bacterium]